MNVFDVLREKLKEKSELYRREEEIQKANPCYQIGVYGFKATGYEDAIEIVNQVEQEYNNDFCEWKHMPVTEGLFVSHGEPEKLINVESWDFCPYCGKKIKLIY